jgi:hypothetical protein
VADKEISLNLKLAVISTSSGSLLLQHSQPPIFDGGDDIQRKNNETARIFNK